MRVNNYTIHHLDISQGIRIITDQTATDFYCVFWYRSIPLGEAYLSFSQINTPGELLTQCLLAVWPVLAFYGCKEKPLTEDQLIESCKVSIGGLHPENIPPHCDISVIICTRNRAASLNKCLDALTNQVCKPGEIIVIDNAPSDNATRDVVHQYSDVRYVREDRKGLDIARNTGAFSARFPIVAYTDDDTIPDPLWAYRIHEAFQSNDIQAMTGLVIAGSLSTEAEIIFEKFWPFNRGYIPKLFGRRFFNATLPDGPPVWEIGAGANMAFRKSVFDDVGYFDERLDVGAAGCSGDSELWYRILANGYKILYNPLAVVLHFHRTSLQALKEQLFCYMRGFTVAILIQHQRFGHRGNLMHLFKVIPLYYLSLLRKGFPKYRFQYQTLFSEIKGILSGMFYFLRHRNSNARIYYGHDNF